LDEATASVTGDAAFRREAAHALSTPLGSLLLQAELIEHYLGQGKIDRARDAVAALLKDFEAYGHRFRSVFSAMEDIAEDGDGGSDPRASLAEALSELGEIPTRIDYRGPSPALAVPAPALTALLRRLATLALVSGDGATATVDAVPAGKQCRLSLIVEEGGSPASLELPFDSARALDFRVAAEIAARHGGSATAGGAPGVIAVVTLPLEAD
jgi:hypothetical protein